MPRWTEAAGSSEDRGGKKVLDMHEWVLIDPVPRNDELLQ